MDRHTLLEWLKLIRTPGLGPVRINRLLTHFGNADNLLSASTQEWQEVPGIQPPFVQKIQHLRQTSASEPLQSELNRLQAMGGRILILGDEEYPPLLREIADPPPALFVLGAVEHLLRPNNLAIVGSRQATPPGCAFAHRLARELAQQEIMAVSGLAEGIDTAAHWGAIEGGSPTVAVLATGLDVIYPSRNHSLRRRIITQGCLVTEAPLGTMPAAYLFPPRNRIISGLCRGVAVIEAASRSGSLVTARMALEQGRELFAVPAQAGDPRYQGSNQLLRQGAILLENTQDILNAFSWDPRPVRHNSLQLQEPINIAPVAAGTSSAAVHALLKQGPMQGDELARRSHLTVTELSRILLQLELVGVVQRLPGNHFALGQSGLANPLSIHPSRNDPY
ncbi:DNA-processing protein DprA [Candidatus Magnetaquicoccus inordinatus]|uniref:DNA-processing protein DprA n=1 Tax=Candidatus Magnetaquicoccus inordinatus TaxID=2496818 RepID=UPI00102BCA11|nr:DNA-processing protein DprA [Candidatus Magnetaquicoccus inordinatus]